MEILDKRTPHYPDLPADYTLRLTSDWQVGASGSAKHLISRVLDDVVNDKSVYVAFLGDLIDNISVKDKRHSWHDLDPELPTLLDQMRFVTEKIRPCAEAGKVVSLGAGNHEFVSLKDAGDPTLHMALGLRVPYGGYSAVAKLSKHTQAMLWHGRKSISSVLPDPFQRRLAIKRRLVATNRERFPEFHDPKSQLQLFAQGHVNHLVTVSPGESTATSMKVDWARKKLVASTKPADSAWYVSAGSLQKLYVEGVTTYAEARGYGPLPLGFVDVHIEAGRIVDCEEVVLG